MHKHAPSHHPPSGTGYLVCDCGATRRIENGLPVGDWHTCPLCVPANLCADRPPVCAKCGKGHRPTCPVTGGRAATTTVYRP
jgi:hypothetical protein